MEAVEQLLMETVGTLPVGDSKDHGQNLLFLSLNSGERSPFFTHFVLLN